MGISTASYLENIAQHIIDKKGVNLLCLDVRLLTTFTSFFIIAEATSERHALAIASSLIEEMRKRNLPCLQSNGLSTGDWVVIDFSDVIVHLFTEEMRRRYNLEEVWMKSSLVPLSINYGPLR